eukprot:scaffold32557_cov99-Isochrysis_galbana.AAC.3
MRRGATPFNQPSRDPLCVHVPLARLPLDTCIALPLPAGRASVPPSMMAHPRPRREMEGGHHAITRRIALVT